MKTSAVKNRNMVSIEPSLVNPKPRT